MAGEYKFSEELTKLLEQAAKLHSDAENDELDMGYYGDELSAIHARAFQLAEVARKIDSALGEL